MPDLNQKNKYDASSIVVLKNLEAVKKRPGMYIGDTDDGSGLHHMVFEVLDNAVDESLAGYCTSISIRLHEDNSVSISDNGRGIPVDIHSEEGVSAAELIMTKLHAGGKFNASSYKVSGGLHGVGVSVVNALSSKLELNIHRDGKEYEMKFEHGNITKQIEAIGPSNKTGTTIRFYPCKETFKIYEFNYNTIVKKSKEIAFLNAGLEIKVSKGNKGDVFKYDGGLKHFLDHIMKDREAICQEAIYCKSSIGDIQVECALNWAHSYESENILCFTNNIFQKDGGVHMTALKIAISKALLKAISLKGKHAKEDISGDDIREGIHAVLSIRMPDPKFSSQTKDKLISSEVRSVIEEIIFTHIQRFLDFRPRDLNALIDHAVIASQARRAAKKAREIIKRKDPVSSILLPGKLSDCQSKDPSVSELFIVEGDSAGGSAKQARQRENQAILPLRGKILNVEKASMVKILSSKEISALISAIGAGIENSSIDELNGSNSSKGVNKSSFDLKKIRYHKIVIMTDADVDGSHIKTLLLTFFYRHMPQIIENGFVYVAQPPLFHLKSKGNKRYIKDEIELNKILIERGIDQLKSDDIENFPEFLMSIVELTVQVKKISRILNVDFLIIESLVYAGLNTYLKSLNEDEITEDSIKQYFDKIIEFLYLQKKEEFYAIDTIEWKCELIHEFDEFDYESSSHQEQSDEELEYEFNDESDKELYSSDIENISHSSRATHLCLLITKKHGGFEYTNKIPLSHIKQLKDFDYPKIPISIQHDNQTHQYSSILKVFELVVDFGNKGVSVGRFKGLGEMNPDELWETTLNHKNRCLLQVDIEDAQKASDLFSDLMGKEVDKRKLFIQKHTISSFDIDI